MTLDMFFKKFDQFADAPDAVAKMRELIRQFAVQGRLVPQDPKEEPATTLFKRILVERTALMSSRRGRDEGETSEFGADSVPYAAPKGWLWVPLGKVQVFTNGYAFKSEDYKDSGVGIIRMGELGSNGEIDESGMKYVSTEIAKSLPEMFQVKPGDLLMGMSGSIGKLAINRSKKVYLLNQRVGRLEPILIEKSYLHEFLKTVERHYLSISFGMAIKNLSTKQINETLFPLPPLAEQKRIVAKVDELMALCDRLEAQQQAREAQASALARASLARFAEAPTPANLNLLFHKSYSITPADLRKAILTLAIQGRLLLQDSTDESAEKLFQRIQAEQKQLHAKGICKIPKPLPPVAESEVPFLVPVSWKWFRLRTLVSTLGDGLHGTPEYSAGTDCHFINGNNLIDGRIVIKPHTKTVSMAEMQKHKKPMTQQTVLVSINGTLGSVAFYNDENVVLGKSACYFNLSSFVDKHFIKRLIESPYFVDYAVENSTGTTIRNLGLMAMNNFPIPLPPLAEQRRIVAKANQLMAMVDQLETQLAAFKTTAKNLLEALVAELAELA